jgi:hypothetical protein
LQVSLKVEGPACNSSKAQGLFKETVTAKPWISDPTVVDARMCGEPRREPGARVHGGRHRRGTPRIDHSHPCASEMQRRACRKGWLRGGVRRRLAGVASGLRSRPPNRPRVGAMRSEATRACDRGVKEDVCASTTAGARRGRRDYSGEVARATVRP